MRLLIAFERKASSASERFFFNVLVDYITLHEERMGTRSPGNQVKIISEREPYWDGYVTGNVTDALSCF